MALKIAVDAALVRWLTGASIGLWAYLSPVLAHREAMFEGGSDEVIGLIAMRDEPREDAKEGIASFLEKRAPEYPDTVSGNMPDFYPWWDEPGYS